MKMTIHEKIKQEKLVNKSDISKNAKLATLATSKIKSRVRQNSETWNPRFELFSWLILFGDDGFQNMFVYQPILNTLELKEDKGTDSILSL